MVANTWPWHVSLQLSGESLKQNTSATLLLSNYLDNIYLQYKYYSCYKINPGYRLGPVNLNTVNSKFHLIRSFFEIFARFLSFHV